MISKAQQRAIAKAKAARLARLFSRIELRVAAENGSKSAAQLLRVMDNGKRKD